MARIAEARDLAPDRPTIDAGPASRRLAEQLLPADDHPSPPPGRARDRLQFRRSLGVGHGAGILAWVFPRVHLRRTGARRVSCRERNPRGAQSTPVSDGHVIIIGGAEDKVRDRVILSRFASLAGGRDATVAVISTASSLGELGR